MDCKAISFWLYVHVCAGKTYCTWCVCCCRWIGVLRRKIKKKEKVFSQLISPSLFLSPSLSNSTSMPFFHPIPEHKLNEPPSSERLSYLFYSSSFSSFLWYKVTARTGIFMSKQTVFRKISFCLFLSKASRSLLKQSKPCDDPQNSWT